MTDPTLTPEVYGDFGLHLEQMRKPDTSKITVVAGPTMEQRQEHVERARQVIQRPDLHTRVVVRDAAQVLRAWGDFTDQVMCDAVIYQFDKQDWDEIDRKMSEARAALRAAERDRNVVMWLVIASAVVTAAYVAATVWSWQ